RLCVKPVLRPRKRDQFHAKPQRTAKPSDDRASFTYNMPKPVWEERTDGGIVPACKNGPELAATPANIASA
ncbi:MAG TPA: hypothetical protein VNS63_18970, partial [Blastocatellia bacterium]|nr:hypothetical protein [Blastocatellia bacterium]